MDCFHLRLRQTVIDLSSVIKPNCKQWKAEISEIEIRLNKAFPVTWFGSGKATHVVCLGQK